MPTIPFGAVNTSRDFSFVFSALSPGLHLAVIENFTLQNVEGPLTTTYVTGCTGASTFQTVQLSNSVIYLLLHRFSHFISFRLYVYRKAKRKITSGLYVGKGSEKRPFQIWDLFPRPTDLQFERVSFQAGVNQQP